MMKLSQMPPTELLSDPFVTMQLVVESLARNIGAEWWLWAQIGVALAFGLIIDISENRDLVKRYLSRNFRVDVTYALVDLFHLAHFTVLVPAGLFVVKALETHAGWLTIGALAELPIWAQFLILFIVVDFWVYWYHRIQHTNIVMWQFHKTHHSQVHMTSLTVFRMSILDRLVTLLFLSVPTVILGVSYTQPLAVLVVIYFHQLLLHAGTGWTFGPLGRIIVSPSFHEVHHSTLREHVNSNYGGILTLWDHLFGTAVARGDKPITWGLIGEHVPESYIQQMFVPIVGLYGLTTKPLAQRRNMSPFTKGPS